MVVGGDQLTKSRLAQVGRHRKSGTYDSQCWEGRLSPFCPFFFFRAEVGLFVALELVEGPVGIPFQSSGHHISRLPPPREVEEEMAGCD